MPPNSSDEFEVNERKMFALCMRNDYFVTCFSAAKHSEIIVASFASYFEFPAAICVALLLAQYVVICKLMDEIRRVRH